MCIYIGCYAYSFPAQQLKGSVVSPPWSVHKRGRAVVETGQPVALAEP